MYMYSGNTNGLMYMYLDLSIFQFTIKRPMGPITHMDASVFNFGITLHLFKGKRLNHLYRITQKMYSLQSTSFALVLHIVDF